MSLLFNNISDVAQIHVLIIGVGAYAHLNGGTDPKDQSYFSAQSLGQLTTSVLSAKAFYDTVLELAQEKRNDERGGSWAKPLGSVEVLISQDPNVNVGFPGGIEEATRSNIERAYFDWKLRCDTRADNIAIFYFCGHGLEKGEHILLANDFGRIPQNPWNGSFAFDMTRRAFSGCKAEAQLFFIDACRQLTSDMILMGIPLDPLEPPSIRASDCKFNLTQKAAAPTESAFGPKNGVSFYTQALIGALKGNAADNDDSFWRVNTGTIAHKMNSLVQLLEPGDGIEQRCISTTSDVTDIIHFNCPPLVPVIIDCDPNAALEVASLGCVNINTKKEHSRLPNVEPWEFEIEAGIYQIKANFTNGAFKSTSVIKPISPPKSKQQINCSL